MALPNTYSFMPPRAAVFHGKTDTPDLPAGYREQIMQWRGWMLAEADVIQKTNREYMNIRAYINAVEGIQHAKNRASFRSRFVDNRIGVARFNELASLTDIRPKIEVTASRTDLEQQASTIENCIVGEWQRRGADMTLVQIIDHALLGTAFAKTSAFAPGELRMTACGVDSVIPIGMSSHIQDSMGVLYKAFHHPGWYLRMYGSAASGIEREARHHSGQAHITLNRPATVDDYTWATMSPAMKYNLARRSGVTADNGQHSPFIELQEFWVDDWSRNESKRDVLVRNPYLSTEQHNYWYVVKPGERLFPRKRLIVFGGERLLYDGPSPFWHGQFPFAMLRMNPVCWAMYGLSKYRDLMPVNQAINEIGAGVLEMIKKALSPTVVSRDGAVSPADWERFYPDLPSQKLKLTMNGNPQVDLAWQKPPELPGWVLNHLMGYLLPEFDKLSGIMDIASLAGKKQVPGGDTIEQMRDALQTPLRLEGRFIETFLNEIGYQSVSNVTQTFSARRRYRLYGEGGLTWHDFDYDPGSMKPWSDPVHSHWQYFNFNVKQGSSLSASRDRHKLIGAQLFKLGAISQQELLRLFDYPDSKIEQIMGEMLKEAQIKAMLTGAGAAGAGGGDMRLMRSDRNPPLSAAA